MSTPAEVRRMLTPAMRDCLEAMDAAPEGRIAYTAAGYADPRSLAKYFSPATVAALERLSCCYVEGSGRRRWAVLSHREGRWFLEQLRIAP